MLVDILNKLFGQEKFKSDIHEDAVYAILEGEHNVCIRMPPKSGKSICYQLPACMQKGKVTFIISPSLNRIKRHVQFLHSRGLNAYCYTRQRSGDQRFRLINKITSNASKATLIYLTAERSTCMDFKEMVKYLKRRKLISYVVIEEADCISRIGPHSKWYFIGMRRLRYLLASMPVILMTTVGTKEIMDDVLKHLRLCKPIIYSVPMFCPSVYYDVWYLETLQQPFDHLRDYIVKTCGHLHTSELQEKKNKCIIYCKSKNTTELIASKLNLLAVPTVACHSALKNEARTIAKKKWLSGEANVIAVTTDIEADVQKDSVGCIVHWMIPESISKFYLRTSNVNLHIGKVFSRVYFSNKAYVDLKLSAKEENVLNVERLRMKKRELVTTISFCLLQECRHAFISSYFGEKLSPCKSLCDVCCEPEQIAKRVVDFKAYVEGNTPQEEENVFSPMNITPDMFDDDSDQQNIEKTKAINEQFDSKVELTAGNLPKLLEGNHSNCKQVPTLPSIERDVNESSDSSKNINLSDKNHDKIRPHIEEATLSDHLKATSEQLDQAIQLSSKIDKQSEKDKVRFSQMPAELSIEQNAKLSQNTLECININDQNVDIRTRIKESTFNDTLKATSKSLDMNVEFNGKVPEGLKEEEVKCSQMSSSISIDCDTKKCQDSSDGINLNNKNDDGSETNSEDSIFDDDVKATRNQFDEKVECNKEIQGIPEKEKIRCSQMPLVFPIKCNTNKYQNASSRINVNDEDDESETYSEDSLCCDIVKRISEKVDTKIQFDKEKQHISENGQNINRICNFLSIKRDTKEPRDRSEHTNLNDKNYDKSRTNVERCLLDDDVKEISEHLDPEIEFIAEIKTIPTKDQHIRTQIPTVLSVEYLNKMSNSIPKCSNFNDKHRDEDRTRSEKSFNNAVTAIRDSPDPEIEFITEIKKKPQKDSSTYKEISDSLSTISNRTKAHNAQKCIRLEDKQLNKRERSIGKSTLVTKIDEFTDAMHVRNLKRKAAMSEDMRQQIKRKKNDLQEISIDSDEYTISATQNKLDAATNLMAKYKLNRNEVSLVPLKKLKPIRQNRR